MRFNIDEFRRLRNCAHTSRARHRDQQVEYRIEIRSSSATMPPFVTRSKKQLAEQLVIVSSQLQEYAERDAGHQALYVYARRGREASPELISMQKYSLFKNEWVCLNGVGFAYETLDPKRIVEALDLFEAEAKVSDPIDDPEVDDDPTPPGERKRSQWREKSSKKKGDVTPLKKKPWSLPRTVMGASLDREKN